MTYEIISTGSKGNAVLINNDILIDCGVPFSALEGKIKSLKLVLLTHIHGDHFRPATIKKLHKLRPRLRFACGAWLAGALETIGINKRCVDNLDCGKTYDYEAYSVKLESIPHDAPNGCWTLREKDGESLFYATDCAALSSISAPGIDFYLVEANYTEADLKARMDAKIAAGQFAYESRVAETHLSREQATEWLKINAGECSKFEFIHIHAEDKQ